MVMLVAIQEIRCVFHLLIQFSFCFFCFFRLYITFDSSQMRHREITRAATTLTTTTTAATKTKTFVHESFCVHLKILLYWDNRKS